jgi:DNA polymerase-3 subunit epsilon
MWTRDGIRVGFLSWVRGRGWRLARTTQTVSPPTQVVPGSFESVGQGFVVVDVETTGLVATRDRIVEIAVVRTDPFGRLLDEWTTLLNPDRAVGASHIHGITAVDVRSAPRFGDIVGELTARLAGRAVVAHNARFDIGFLQAEYERAGWTMPAVPHLCTLDASWIYLPDLARRRLADCCWASGIDLQDAHSSLGDATATAQLLATFMDPRIGLPPALEHRELPARAASVAWPPVPMTSAHAVPRKPRTEEAVPAPEGTLVALLDVLPLSTVVDEGAPTASQPYLELLFQVLEDGVLTQAEAESLVAVAQLYSLTREQVVATHRGFLLALAHRIVEDGKITRDERRLLKEVAHVLGFGGDLPAKVLDEAEKALRATRTQECRPLPASWTLGTPLRIGDGVAFTGCDEMIRARLEGSAQAAGLRVTGSVSGRTVVLVTDGAHADTTKAVAARRLGTRVVTPEVFAELVEYVQPAEGGAGGRPENPGGRSEQAPVERAIDPAVIRAWAREHGYSVGVRGRIPEHVVHAFRAAEHTDWGTPLTAGVTR